MSRVQSAIGELLQITQEITDDLTDEQLNLVMSATNNLVRPVSTKDAEALISLLPASGDLCFGLNWTILHAIESCPDWPIWPALKAEHNEWVDLLRLRLSNGGIFESD